MSQSYDLAVAWRIYPGVSKTPLIHSNDKFRLVQTCLLSFIESARGLSVKYYMILDGCPPVYEALIRELLPAADVEIITTNAIGNLATFALQVDILSKQTAAALVYFAEDDYLYRPGEFTKMVQLIRNDREVDFVTCYASTDLFNHPIHDHARHVKYSREQLWLSSSSTCMTFLTTRKTLTATRSLLLTYSKGNNDCAIWLILTRTHILNPFRYWRYFRLKDKESFNIMKVAVKYSLKYFLAFRRYQLWVPYPGIGTHLEKGLIVQPEIWEKLASEIDATRL